jgi:GNAT superfamily N-acetyltransferase
MSREYPDEIAGPYELPPVTFEDRNGREIEVRRYDGGPDTLVEMYRAFDPEDRAQGIPPMDETQIRNWLEKLLDEEFVNLVAWHDGSPIGHAMLVPDDEGASELAIFVLREYQDAGIGTGLIEALLGAGRGDGIEHVWLTVERWNKPAIALYRKVGFVPTNDGSFELEMAAELIDKAE